MKPRHLGPAIICTILLCTPPAYAVLVDNFNFVNYTVMAGAAGSDNDGGPVAPSGNTIGDARTLDIPGGTAVSGTGNLTMATDPADTNVLTFSLDALTSGSAKLTWDADGAGLGGADLTDGGGSTFFTFDILNIDQGNVDLTVTVDDTGGGSSTRVIAGAGVGTQQFSFASFTGTADFTDADMIMLEILGRNGSDLVLDQLFTSGGIAIPEPSAFMLGSLGVIGLLAFRRRYRVR